MSHATLYAHRLTAGYASRPVLSDIDLAVTPGHTSVIVGANACGKSTLLRSLSRLLKPDAGSVTLDGQPLHALPARRLARRLGLLPQSPIAPEGITVLDLVGRGRHPHQGIFQRWSHADSEAVSDALAVTGTASLAERSMDELSGGQRQRVWIAMVLAQQTDILLLDEPTTFLDINHQIEVLDLLADLTRQRGTTTVMVLHELNLAARYADELIAMSAGRIYARGTPEQVLTRQTVKDVFGLDSHIITDPISGRPMMIPLGRHRRRRQEASKKAPSSRGPNSKA